MDLPDPPAPDAFALKMETALAYGGGERARAALAAQPAAEDSAHSIEHRIAAIAADRDYWREQALKAEAALAAHPPVAPVAALTDVRIERIVRAHGTGGWQTVDDMVKFARAIESELRPRIKG